MPFKSKSKSMASSVATGQKSEGVDEFFECDYERSCTPLYKAIEKAIVQEEEDFDDIATFLETSAWKEGKSKNEPSAKAQAKTWVTRFDKKKQVEWSQLPLHLAIVGGAPSDVIGSLVKLNPQALRCTDDQRMLPLHLALRHGADDEVVAFLLMQFPDAVNATGKNGRTPVDCALRAREKIRGIILETFVEKTKAKEKVHFNAAKTSYVTSLENATAQMDIANKDLICKAESLRLLRKEHNALLAEYDLAKIQHASDETTLIGQLEDAVATKEDFEVKALHKIEKLTSSKLSESVELQKKIDSLTAEKAFVEQTALASKTRETQLSTELNFIQKMVAEAVTTEDWIKLKQEVYKMNSYRLTRDFDKAKDTVDALLSELKATIEPMQKCKTKLALKSMVKNVTKLQKCISSAKTTQELDLLQSQAESIREEMRELTGAPKMLSCLAGLRKSFLIELKTEGGKTEEQMTALKKAVASTSPDLLDSKTSPELTAIKVELEALKLELAEKALSRNTAADIKELERTMEATLKVADAKTKAELAPVKNAIEGLRTYVSKPKSNEDLVAVAKDVDTLKELLQKKRASANIQTEATFLKEAVQIELAKSSDFQEELLQMNQTITDLANDGVETKDFDELSKIKDDLANVKEGLKGVEESAKAQKSLNELKKKVEGELSNTAQRTEKELSEMKLAVDTIDLEQKEASKLKDSLSAEINKANGQLETDLKEMMNKVNAMNLSELENKSKSEWESVHKELEILKSELNTKQQSKMEEEMSGVKEAIAQIRREQASSVDDEKFTELRKEMDSLRQGLKSPSMTSPKRAKKVKGFFGMFRRNPSSGASVVSTNSIASRRSVSSKRSILGPSADSMAEVSNAKNLTIEIEKSSEEPLDEGGDSNSPPSPKTFCPPRFSSPRPTVADGEAADEDMTILPPSMSIMSDPSLIIDEVDEDAENTSSDEEENAPPAVQMVLSQEKTAEPTESEALEVTLSLHKTMGKPTIDTESVKAMPSFSPRVSPRRYPSSLRKTRSMGPGAQTPVLSPSKGRNVTIDPYEIVRTWSKLKIQDNGEVELEPVEDSDSPKENVAV